MSDGTLGLYPLGLVPLGGLLAADTGIVDPETLYFATEDWTSAPGDAAPNRPYDGRARGAFILRRSVIGPNTPVGRFGLTSGEIELLNGDGKLDDFIGGSGLDGRAIVIRRVARGAGLDQARTVFSGVMAGASGDLDAIVIAAASRDVLLRGALNTAFAGGGGLEGGDDQKGQQKPVALGRVRGVAPIYMGQIGGKETYLVAGGKSLPIKSVTAFYDKGLALTKVAGTPAAGEFSEDIATGAVVLGAAAAELATCDIDGYAPGGVFKSNASDIIQAVWTDFAGQPNARLDGHAFLTLAGDEPAAVGIWLGPEANATPLAAMQAFAAGAHFFIAMDNLDRLTAAALKPPGGAIRAILDTTNMTSIERLSAPAALDPPAWRHEVGYGFNYTVTSNVAPAAAAAQREFMERQWRVAAAADASIQNRNLTAPELFTPGRYAAAADAQAKADALLNLYAGRAIWGIEAGLSAVPEGLEIGHTVELRTGRFGLDGRLGTVVGIASDAFDGTLRLEVFA